MQQLHMEKLSLTINFISVCAFCFCFKAVSQVWHLSFICLFKKIYFNTRHVALDMRTSRINKKYITVESHMVKPDIHQELKEKLKWEPCTTKLFFTSCSYFPPITTSSVFLYHSSYNIFSVNCFLYVYLPFTFMVRENLRKYLCTK